MSAKVLAMQSKPHEPAMVSPPYRTRAGTDVEQRRRAIVALLHQHPHGLTARAIREATGCSKSLTDSALAGLVIRRVVHKRGHCYGLAAHAEAVEHA
jgi:hypothetical protein